jgi:hypothetical protein
MSRPPRPYPSTEVSGGLPIRNGALQVFAPSFQDLVDVETALSAQELGLLPPGGEGDFATTLFELSAMVAHVLGVYQDFYGGEAFLGTAQTQQSLVRHGRRVAYATDPGVAATGVISVQVKKGLSGDIDAGLPLLTVPKGTQTTQSYETLESRHVDVRWNVIQPTGVTVAKSVIAAGTNALEIQGVGHGLAAGDTVLLVAAGTPDASAVQPALLTLAAVSEDAVAGTTTLSLTNGIPAALQSPLSGFHLLAKPALNLRVFGWNADPRLFPPDQLQQAGEFISQGATVPPPQPGPPGTTVTADANPVFGYEVHGKSSASQPSVDHPQPEDIYLADALVPKLQGQWVVRLDGDGTLTPYFVTLQEDVSVSFVREQEHVVVVTPPSSKSSTKSATSGTGKAAVSGPVTTATLDPVTSIQLVPQWISASTTRLNVIDGHGVDLKRADAGNDPRSRWLGGWTLDLALQLDDPSTEQVAGQLTLDGDFTGLQPGMLIVITKIDRTVAQLVELTLVEVVTTATPTVTNIQWKPRGPVPAGTVFVQSDIVVLGNVIRVSHGKSLSEILGDSDGVTPFLRFSLKKSPVTQLPDATGAVPALEVRISDVLWTSVADFAHSGPDDRHYVVQRDEAQVTTVVFGDGRQGAIPPSGQRHIKANYRVGLGVIGNVEAGRLSRIEKAHPLVENLINPLPIAGGTEPANISQVRQQATRFIRTFDRAVSASDYADLALLFPGVARSRATSSPIAGITLVAADADGNPLVDAQPFRNFLDARRDLSVPLTFLQPEPVPIFVEIEVEFDPAFFPWQVEQAVRETLISTDPAAPGLFTFPGRDLGEPAHLSRLYEVINAAAGVVFSQVLHFDLAPEDVSAGTPTRVVRDVLQVAPQQWLTLDPRTVSPPRPAPVLKVRAVPRGDI